MISSWPESAPILIVGCGNMAGAMLSRWLACGLSPEAVTVVRRSGVPPHPGVRTISHIPDEPRPRVVLLGVKPQVLDEVAADVARVVGRQTLVLSILAGTEVAALKARMPDAGAIVRAMPNMPVSIGRGAIALHGDPGAFQAEVEGLMSVLGTWEWIGDEQHFHALTALVGSGPAFLFRFLEALAEGSRALGLPSDQALRLTRAMVDGASGLALISPEPPQLLVERVASPGGTTRAGLAVLDPDLMPLVQATLHAAARRSEELAGGSR